MALQDSDNADPLFQTEGEETQKEFLEETEYIDRGYEPPVRNPLALEMPVEPMILHKARQLVGDRNIMIQELATCVSQDPILTLELLRVSNAMFFVQDRPPITTPRTAVVRLGSENVIDILENLSQRQQIPDPIIAEEFGKLRNLGRRTSIVARLIATRTNKEFAEEAQTVGLMTSMGHLMACIYFGYTYVNLSHTVNRVSLVYRLAQEHNFDIRSRQLSYLRKQGFPELLMFALDREMAAKTLGRVRLRFIVESAQELVGAFDSQKWERYQPEKDLPSNSALRLLQMSQSQYESVYEKSNEFLCQAQLENSPQEPESDPNASPSGQSLKTTVILTESELETSYRPQSLLHDDEIADFFYRNRGPSTESTPQRSPEEEAQLRRERILDPEPREPVDGKLTPEKLAKNYAFDSVELPEEPVFVVASESLDAPPPNMRTERAQQLVSILFKLCQGSKTAEDLLVSLLSLLIQEGPFVRASLIVLAPDRRTAYIHTAVGDGLHSGSTISMTDPLNPLVSCLTKVRSFNIKGMRDVSAPLGIMAYAISPLIVENKTPVALYADCGEEGALTFDARVIFRMVVGLVNQVLPELPGGLPDQDIPLS